MKSRRTPSQLSLSGASELGKVGFLGGGSVTERLFDAAVFDDESAGKLQAVAHETSESKSEDNPFDECSPEGFDADQLTQGTEREFEGPEESTVWIADCGDISQAKLSHQ